MRNLPAVTTIMADSNNLKTLETSVDLKQWLKTANSEDLYALYMEDVSNNTGFRFHDLLFNLYYEEKSARRFREEILHNFRDLINGTTTLKDIKNSISS